MGDKMNFEIIKREIDRWDPIDLLCFAPPDEYDMESREILSKYQHNSAEQNGRMIHDVFSSAFGITFAKSVEECISIAEKIMKQGSPVQNIHEGGQSIENNGSM